jgi:FixJ family two-component response regulator
VLLTAIRDAIERSRVALDRESELRALHEWYSLLTWRERDVRAPVVAARLNKASRWPVRHHGEYG